MSFDFLGTFSRSQFNDLVKFVTKKSQLGDLDARIDHLTAEIVRLGNVTPQETTVDVNNVTVPVFIEDKAVTNANGVYSITGVATLVGKQLLAIKNHNIATTSPTGNKAESLDTPYYLTPQGIKDGSYVAGIGNLNDASTSIVVTEIKKHALDQIKRKREHRDYRLKKIRDLREQLEDKRALLVQQREETAGAINGFTHAPSIDRLNNLIAIVNTQFDTVVQGVTASGSSISAFRNLVKDTDITVGNTEVRINPFTRVKVANTKDAGQTS